MIIVPVKNVVSDPSQSSNVDVAVTEIENRDTTIDTVEVVGSGNVSTEIDLKLRQIGIAGTQGIQGDEGQQGIQGEKGDDGVTWRGTYNASNIYNMDDIVKYFGNVYINLTGNNTVPTNTSDWEIFTEASASGDLNEVFEQNTPASTWVVVHNMGKFPAPTVLDSTDTVVIGDVIFPDPTTIIFNFSKQITGKVFLN